MMIAHVGHDHGVHHWLPQLIVAAAIATMAVVAWRQMQRQRD